MEAEILSLKQQLAAQAQEITLLKGRLAAYEMAASVRAAAVGDAETLLATLPAAEAEAAAQAFETAREQAAGLQYLAVQGAEDQPRFDGFWMLRALPDG